MQPFGTLAGAAGRPLGKGPTHADTTRYGRGSYSAASTSFATRSPDRTAPSMKPIQ